MLLSSQQIADRWQQVKIYDVLFHSRACSL